MSRWLPFPGKRQALQSKGWETTSPQGFGCEQVPTQALGFPHALKIPGENEAQGEHQLQSQLWRVCKATIVFTKTAPLGVAPPKLWPQDKEPHISQNPKHIFKAQGWDQPASHPGSPPHQEMFLRESMAISCWAWTREGLGDLTSSSWSHTGIPHPSKNRKMAKKRQPCFHSR